MKTEDSHPLPILWNPGEFGVAALEIKYLAEENTKEENALIAYNPKLNNWGQNNVHNRSENCSRYPNINVLI